MDIVFLIIGLAAGGAVGFLLARQKAQQAAANSVTDARNELASVQASRDHLETRMAVMVEDNRAMATQLEQQRQDGASMSTELGIREEKLRHLTERLEIQKQEMENMHQRLTNEFQNISLKILQQNSKQFEEHNRERLGQILDPLKERIKEFEQRVEKTYNEDSKERITLKTEIKNLLDLNKQLSTDATNLTNALKGESKTQGDWGEMQLEMLLEKAGLIKDIHYETQSAHRDEAGQLKKPDFVINLPEDKHLIIDSKVSLTAYDQYFNASEEDRPFFLKQHLESLRNHIRDLGSKNYQQLYQINAPDYVLMFIPIEPAFALALQTDGNLFEQALDRNIVLVTSSTLLATMRTVSFIWRQDNQKKNVLEIARQSGALYDKFVGFLEDMKKIKRNIDLASGAYDDAYNKLRDGKGNLIRRAEEIKKLGAKASKAIPKEFKAEPAPENLLDE